MAVKRMDQLSLAAAFVSPQLGANAQLERLHALVQWSRFEKRLGHLRAEGAPGRPGYPVLLLFKAILLQSLYGLSERELEEALNDRLSFRRFVGLELDAAAPDHTVLNRFRNRLASEQLLEDLFAELSRQLDKAGVMLKRGTMLDATLIETTAARPGMGERGRDGDAAFARHQGKGGSTYGYKAHVGVDAGSGLVRRVITTPANVNETDVADGLICGDEAAVLGDAAYHTHARERALKGRGVKARLMRRANRHHPRLPARLARYNRLIARRRAAVETTFATWKRRMRLAAIRYVGLGKASAQVLLVAMAFNLRRWVTLCPA